MKRKRWAILLAVAGVVLILIMLKWTQHDSNKTSANVIQLSEIDIFGQDAFIDISAGEFIRGSTAPCSKGEELPIHRVQITKPFSILREPVAIEAWEKIMKDTETTAFAIDGKIVDVTWLEAVEFTKRLSDYTGENYSLPTEAEWEYAARKALDQVSVESSSDYLEFFTIGEWCYDAFQGYRSFGDPAVDPIWGPRSRLFVEFFGEEFKIVRGLRHDGECSVPYSHRDYYTADYKTKLIGFRIVRINQSQARQ